MINDKLPIWLEEAKDLKDGRSIWDWIKFNIRTGLVRVVTVPKCPYP